jgi:cytochrome o ubiquinol oxidase operon protein cyoD
VPKGLVVLAIAQMGVHLVFFLHITDNTNNVLALTFCVLIVFLVVVGRSATTAHASALSELQAFGSGTVRPGR